MCAVPVHCPARGQKRKTNWNFLKLRRGTAGASLRSL